MLYDTWQYSYGYHTFTEGSGGVHCEVFRQALCAHVRLFTLRFTIRGPYELQQNSAPRTRWLRPEGRHSPEMLLHQEI